MDIGKYLSKGVNLIMNVDLNKLRTAITYVDRIAYGKNPVNNNLVTNDDTLNDSNIIRCMFFLEKC